MRFLAYLCHDLLNFLLEGFIKLPIWRESSNTHVWWFWVISDNAALLGLVVYWPWLDVDGFNPPFFSCLQFFAAMIVVINLSMTLFGATRNIFVKEFLEFAGIILFVLRNVWAIPWPRARSCRSCRCVSSYDLETRDALRIFFFFDSAPMFLLEGSFGTVETLARHRFFVIMKVHPWSWTHGSPENDGISKLNFRAVASNRAPWK